jgi:hypothetical protein
MAGVATAPACPARQGDARQPRRLRSGRTPPSQTVTWTRLLNFTAGRRTHTMACAHSELSTGHCGRRIGTKIFQDDSCSPSTRPAERQVRGVVLSKEQGSLPPSAGNTAAPSRFGELLARVIFCIIPLQIRSSCGCFPHWNSSCSFKGIQEAISEDWSRRLNSRCSRLCASAHPKCVHAVSPSRFQSLIPCGQIPECPNDAFQLLMSCAQATARRDAETGGESGLP